MKHLILNLLVFAALLGSSIAAPKKPIQLSIDQSTGAIMGSPGAATFRSANGIPSVAATVRYFTSYIDMMSATPDAVGQLAVMEQFGVTYLYRGTALSAGGWSGDLSFHDVTLNKVNNVTIPSSGSLDLNGASLRAGGSYNVTFNGQFGTTNTVNFNGGHTLAFTSTGATSLTWPTSGTLISTGNLSTITVVGTVVTGVWNATAIDVSHGGTGVTALTGLVAGNGTSAFSAITTSAGLAGNLSDETGTGALVFGTSPSLTTPLLGTPTSGTLTNCTGLQVSGITPSTSLSLGVGSIELGHASDTTLTRSAAGSIAVEGVTVLTANSSVFNSVSIARGTTRGYNIGTSNTSSGTDVILVGDSNSATSTYSAAIGYSNTVSASTSTALGKSNSVTTGPNNVALGYSNTVTNSQSTAVGNNNTVNGGSQNTAVGHLNVASGVSGSGYAQAFGNGNSATNTHSGAFGENVQVSIQGVQEFGHWPASYIRGGHVRVHHTGLTAISNENTGTPYTDGGSTPGAEGDGTLPRSSYAIRYGSNGPAIDMNSSSGTITSYDLNTPYSAGAIDFNYINAGASSEGILYLTDATYGDFVVLSLPDNVPNGIVFVGYIYNSGEVSIRATNASGSGIAVGSLNVGAKIFHQN